MYEKLFRYGLFPAYETLRGRATVRHIAEYRDGQWLDETQLAQLQLTKLNALLAYCWEHVPFLQDHWRAAGCRPGTLRHTSELAQYPTLTKTLITANYQDMVARPWRGRTLAKATGGSTGEPFRCEYTMEAYARRTAVMWRGYGWGGASLGTRTAYVWGTGMRGSGWGGLKDRLYHAAFNRRFFDALNMNDANIDARIAAIQRYRPAALVGYVAPVVLLARRMLATGARVPGLRGVLTGAEALHQVERSDIEQAFGCKAFDTYGSREVMLMAAECAHHEGLHVSADHLLLETLGADGAPVAAGESGAVAVTDFHNFGMPLVRYLNGDAATYSTRNCSCGRGLPLLESIDGRVLDLLKTPDGRHIPGEYFVMVMLGWPEVRQWQVVQTAPDSLQFRLVSNQPLTPDQHASLIKSVQPLLGDAMRVEIVSVDSIAPTPSGKRRLTVACANAARIVD
ncbi:MAG: phenylacetate--CoA ligase family protein [Betaproteobacteria bacterium]|nr:phenylacetate--CoA ligase family protein [Betaproteobacteria bacterium]